MAGKVKIVIVEYFYGIYSTISCLNFVPLPKHCTNFTYIKLRLKFNNTCVKIFHFEIVPAQRL